MKFTKATVIFAIVSAAISVAMLIAAIWPASATAQTAIHTGGYSSHLVTGDEYDYNDWHRLAAVEYGSVMAGYFRNSYDRDAFILGYGWSKQWGDWRGSVHVGAVYGYRSCFGDEGDHARLCPVAFPALYWTRYRAQPGVILFGEALAATVRVAF